jgi:phosphoglycolate phosphatase
MKRLVLFDIDGTLLSANGAPRRAFTRAMLEVYGTTGPIATHRFDGKTDPQIARELLTLAGLDDAAIDDGMPRLWDLYLHDLREELARPDHATRVYPGVHALLDALEARSDVLLGLLTGNIRPGAELKLESASIRNDFRVGAFGSDCERRDGLPPVAVDRALRLSGVAFARRDIVIIGDTPSDVTCGAALGVRAIAVATGRHGEDELQAAGADVVLPDFADVERVLEVIVS